MAKIGFYAGSFSPVTRGHLSIVCEALNDYDKVIIGVGVNDSKKQLYSQEERCEMINAALDDLLYEYNYQDLIGYRFSRSEETAVARLLENRKLVEIVGYCDLTVDCALRSGATALIRGERIVGDHDSEMQASILNKQILEVRKARLSMATIPVPREDMTYISSSNVRGLCHLGEYIAAQRYVMPSVHALLMKHYLSSAFASLIKELNVGVYVLESKIQEIYAELTQAYAQNRYYHTMSHIAYMMNLLQAMVNTKRICVQNPTAMKLAIFYHDIINTGGAADEKKSCQMMRLKCPDREVADVAEKLIMATAHGCKLKELSPDMEIIHDLDLAILGDTANYGIYAANIRREYMRCSHEGYKANRMRFLTALLAKRRIFLTDAFHELLEKDAHRNIRNELAYWQTV